MRIAVVAVLAAFASGCCIEEHHQDACLIGQGAWCYTVTHSNEYDCPLDDDSTDLDLSMEPDGCPGGTAHHHQTCAELGYPEG